MDRPLVSAYTERLYARWPEYYRNADEANDWALLRWLSLFGDETQTIEDLLDRITDVVDPDRADVAWLPWLAQFGADITGLNERDARTAIANIGTRALASSDALIQAIGARLLDPKRVVLVRRLDGNRWMLGAAVNPADVQSTSWDALEATFADWDAIEAAGSWDAIGDVDPFGSPLIEQQTPAGVELVEVPVGSWWAIEGLGNWDSIEALATWDALQASPF